VASTAADKENVPPLHSGLGKNLTDFTYLSTSSNPTDENTASLVWQSVFSKSLSDQSMFASQERSPLPTLSTHKLPSKQSPIPFSVSLQGSNLSVLSYRAVPTQITGVTTQGEKPVSFAHAVRSNLPPPPPPPKLPAQSYYYGSNTVTEDFVYSQFPEKIQTPSDFGRAIRDAAKTGNPKEGAKLSEGMLRKMIEDFEHKRSKYRPDGACFNAVIHAYAEMGDAHAAEHILTLMHQDFEKGNANAEPNAKIYTNILHAWRKSKSAEAPERCEKILGTMNRLSDTGALPNCKPDAFSYSVAFHCWAESNRQEAAERADRLFREMERRYMAGESGLQPDAILYSNVINIFTKNATTNNRAEELLWTMVHDFLTGNKFAEPKIRNFNTIMAMWSKSTEDIAPYKAQTIVLRMHEFCKENILTIPPDSYTYCLLLKTW
jgi:pentatricopeptide repeat protein